MRRSGRHGWLAALLGVVCVGVTGCGGGPERPGDDGETVVLDLLRVPDSIAGSARALLEFDLEDETAGKLVEGWSRPETDKNGQTFTWAVGPRAVLNVPVLTDDARWLQFNCRPFVGDPSSKQRIDVSIDGVGIGSVEVIPGFKNYSLAIPEGLGDSGQHRVEMTFARVARPLDYDSNSKDDRELAVAFDRLALARHEDPRVALLPVAAARVENGRELVQPTGTELVFPTLVPRDAVLVFGLPGLSDGASGSRARIVIRDAATHEAVVFDSASDTSSSPEQRIDLSSHAGRRVEIVLQSVATGEVAGSLIWERPRLLGDVGGMDLTTDVLLIVIDTLRADALSCYGGAAATPHIDALAASGVRFERAYAHAPMTMPSHSSMFTSLLPTEHGAHVNTQVLDTRHLTLAELLRDAYRQTTAFVSLGVLKARFGISQGFDEYHDEFGLDWWKTAAEVNRELLPWVESVAGGPHFLWVHYSDPHEPYSPPGIEIASISVRLGDEPARALAIDGATAGIPMRLSRGRNVLRLTVEDGAVDEPVILRGVSVSADGVEVACGENCVARVRSNGRPEFEITLPSSLILTRGGEGATSTELRLRAHQRRSIDDARRLYLGEVEAVDAEIGRLLDALRSAGRLDNTLVILTADHGEGLGDHGLLGHVHQLYDTLLHVPLIVSWPGHLAEGQVVTQPVSHVDLLPTVVDLLGLPDEFERSGSSLAPLMSGQDWPAAAIVSETFRPEARADLKSVIAEGYKLIHDLDQDRYELYRLDDDPGELRDLSETDTETLRRLAALLASRVREAGARAMASSDEALSAEDLERLRALGYLQ